MGEGPKELGEEQVEWKWNDTKTALLYEIFKKWNKCKKTKKITWKYKILWFHFKEEILQVFKN